MSEPLPAIYTQRDLERALRAQGEVLAREFRAHMDFYVLRCANLALLLDQARADLDKIAAGQEATNA